MTPKRIGLIGAGHIGSQLARLSVQHGYDVVISNSRGPDTLKDLVRELGPQARAGTSTEAVEAGDLVVVTIPLKNVTGLPAAPFEGKIVIARSRLRHWPERSSSTRTTTTRSAMATFANSTTKS